MKISILIILTLSLFISDLTASPKINFKDLLVNAELNNELRKEAVSVALDQSQPVTIFTREGAIIDAKGIESGKVVYAVIRDHADVFKNGCTAFYEDIITNTDLTGSKIIYADGSVIDNSNGKFSYEITGSRGVEEYLMVPDWTYDRVYLFSKANGDLVDTAFIPSSPSVLASPKMAMQHFSGTSILVADQITDGVFRFDTSGAYIGLFAPLGGINNAILDNIRGIRYRANKNLLVCVANGASQNTIQQFDTTGLSIGTFIGNTNLNSPFDILLRDNDMLISNSSGTNRITRFDLSGNFLSNFYSGTSFAFPQQMQRLPNGNIIVAGFSSPSGIAVLDSNGAFIRLMPGVSGVRSVYLMDNGRYLATNSAGVHEVDTATGTIIRTIVTGANFQYATLYNPNLVVSVGNNNTVTVDDFRLYQNYPNPFNPKTIINFQCSMFNFVSLKVYDILGNEIRTLVNAIKQPGAYKVEFDGSDLASGIYFYSLEVNGNKVDAKRMVLLK